MPTKRRKPPPLMSHADRRRLIEAPITFHVSRGHAHGGVFIDHDIPVDGKRTWTVNPEDEAYLRYGKGEGD